MVVVTRNRVPELVRTLDRLRSLPEEPGVTAVDNASSDGTAETVRQRYPGVKVLAQKENLGGAGRNLGVGAADTPYVAFSDDDSWWEPGALSRAADLLDAHPRLGLLAGRILVGPEEREDPICGEMAHGPLPAEDDLPGPPVLGFLACAAVVRRSAYFDVGGFERRMLIWGEEDLLAADLASAGWGLSYAEDVVAHHHPSTVRDRRAAGRAQLRNALWFAWLRRPAPTATRHTLRMMRAAANNADARASLLEALRGLPWALRRRRVVSPRVESRLQLLDRERGIRALDKPGSGTG